MVSIDISPILEWAWAILSWAVTWVWVFCIIVAAWILWQGAINQADVLVRGGKSGKKTVSRTKE